MNIVNLNRMLVGLVGLRKVIIFSHFKFCFTEFTRFTLSIDIFARFTTFTFISVVIYRGKNLMINHVYFSRTPTTSYPWMRVDLETSICLKQMETKRNLKRFAVSFVLFHDSEMSADILLYQISYLNFSDRRQGRSGWARG